MSRTKKRRTHRPASAAFAFKLIAASFILVVLIKHSFIFLIAGMLPAIVASIVDRSASRYQFKTVAAFNFSGVAPYMGELIQQDNAASAVQNMVAQPSVWLVMYACASLGWVIALTAPKIVRSVIEMFSDNKIFSIEKEQAKLLEEWGAEVRDG